MALAKLTQQALAVKRLLLGSILCEGTVLTQHSVNVSFDILENISTFLSMGITTNPGADWVHDRFIVTDWPVDPVPSNFPYMYSAPLGWSDDRFEGWFFTYDSYHSQIRSHESERAIKLIILH